MKQYDKICIMLPTYGRSKTKLPKFLDSLIDTADDLRNTCISFVVKKSDKGTIDLIEDKCGNTIEYEILREDKKACDLAGFFNLSYEKTRFNDRSTCVSMFGDDMVFKTNGWDTVMLEAINDMDGIGLVYGDDDFIQHENLCVYFITTRDMVELTGKPFMPTGVKYDFMDTVWYEVCKRLNCLRYIPKLHVFHDHASGKGGKDDTWVKMRTASKHNTMIQIDDYVEEIVGMVRTKLKHTHMNNDIVFVMTTYDRVKILRQTVDSWNKSLLLPDRMLVFDDVSNEGKAISREIGRMSNASLITGDKHLGCDGNNVSAVTTPEGCKAIMVIDSDTTFAVNWLIEAYRAWEKIKDVPEIAAITLFNTDTHKTVEYDGEQIDGLVYKESVGGFGTIYKKDIIDNVFSEKPEKNKQGSWDHKIIDYVKKNGLKFCCTKKSYLQHIGYSEGSHISDKEMSDFAEEYVGDVEELSPGIIKHKDKMMSGETVLFAAMARLGDVVAASMVANMVIKEGATLTWLVINKYAKLVNRFCPGAKVISVEPLTGPESEWSETTTDKMMKKYGGYRYYINAQVGARENHYNYITSGKHPCEWIRDRCDLILGTELGSNFRDYLQFDTTGINLGDRDYRPVKSLAIISPESITANNIIDGDILKNSISELRAKGYTPKILMKKRLPGLSIRQVREDYIFGLTIEQCIYVIIKDAMFFVGQDSGMSWCALLSDCKKRIYHNQSRIELVNTYFNMIDENAEDIILE